MSGSDTDSRRVVASFFRGIVAFPLHGATPMWSLCMTPASGSYGPTTRGATDLRDKCEAVMSSCLTRSMSRAAVMVPRPFALREYCRSRRADELRKQLMMRIVSSASVSVEIAEAGPRAGRRVILCCEPNQKTRSLLIQLHSP
jgi:hypothetical protein